MIYNCLVRISVGNSSSRARWSPGRIALLVTASYWTILLLAHWIPDSHIKLPVFYHLSWDEYQYLPTLRGYQAHLAAGDFSQWLFSPEKFGYGDMFWQIYSLLTFPAYQAAEPDSGSYLLWLRLVTLLFQLGSLYVSYRIASLLAGDAAALYAICLLAPMAGLIFLYKPFSPDYFATFLAVTALYASVRWPSKSLLWGAAAGLAIGNKLYNLLVLPPILATAFFHTGWPALAGLVAVPIGFVLANLEIVSTGVAAYRAKLAAFSALVHDPNYGHAIQPPGMISYLLTWLSNPKGSFLSINSPGIDREYFFLPILGAVFVLLLWSARRHQLVAIIGGGGLAALLLLMVATNRVWTWYAFSMIFFISIGAGAACSLWLDGRSGWQTKIPHFLLAVHLCWGLYWTAIKSNEFMSARSSPKTLVRNRFYASCIEPNRSYFLALKENELVVPWSVPVHGIFRPGSACYPNQQVVQCVQQWTNVVVLLDPQPAEQEALAPRFSSMPCGDAGVVFTRK